MDKKLESEFKNRLEKETEEITELKEETWNNISRELFPEEVKKMRTNWMKGLAATLGTVAVAAIMFFVFVTGDFTDETQNDPIQNDPTQDEPVQGTNDPDPEEDKETENNTDENVENDTENTKEETLLEDQFEHEKVREIELEGMKESIQLQLATNEEWRYIIYFDKDRYKFIHGEEVDEVVPAEELGDQYPEVGMEIKRTTGITIEEAILDVRESLASDGMFNITKDPVDWPLEAAAITGRGAELDQMQGDTPIHRYYIIEGENDSLFIFKQKYFSVAEEGHAARFDYMLESFEIVE